MEIANLEEISKSEKVRLNEENALLKHDVGELKSRMSNSANSLASALNHDPEITITRITAVKSELNLIDKANLGAPDVGNAMKLEGEWSDVPPAKEIWIAVYSESDDLFYPQSSPA